jgi:hypothetical protein
MQTSVKNRELVDWIFGLMRTRPSGDDLDRPVEIASFDGRYGIAGYILAVNGSPPRATVVIQPSTYSMWVLLRDRPVIKGERGWGHHLSPKEKRYQQALDWLTKLGLEFTEG